MEQGLTERPRRWQCCAITESPLAARRKGTKAGSGSKRFSEHSLNWISGWQRAVKN
jgi:hypothetical protein